MRSVLFNKPKAFGIYLHRSTNPPCKIRQNTRHLFKYTPRSQYQRDPSDTSTVLDDATAEEIQVQESEAGLTLEGESS